VRSTGTGASVCADCIAGKYSSGVGAQAQGSCVNCPANSVSPAGSNEQTDCECSAGWTGSTGSCVQCGAGKYKNVIGSSACENCITGTYSTTLRAVTPLACLSCPSNSDAAEASGSVTDCICNAGFSGVRGGLCTQCAIVKYRAAPQALCNTRDLLEMVSSATRTTYPKSLRLDVFGI